MDTAASCLRCTSSVCAALASFSSSATCSKFSLDRSRSCCSLACACACLCAASSEDRLAACATGTVFSRWKLSGIATLEDIPLHACEVSAASCENDSESARKYPGSSREGSAGKNGSPAYSLQYSSSRRNDSASALEWLMASLTATEICEQSSDCLTKRPVV